MMLVFKMHIIYKLLLVGFLTLASANTGESVSDVDAPSYYKYDAKPGQFPWVVLIKTVDHCMGTLVHPLWVLTAAHCLEQSSDPSHYTLELGGQVETASELHPYPRYHSSVTTHVRDHSNDIALIKAAKPFRLAPKMQMRQTPYVSDKRHVRPCRVFGSVRELGDPRDKERKKLQFARAYARAFADCYDKTRGQDGVELAMRHTICAVGMGRQAAQACSGNPGGPLVCPVDNVQWRNSTRTEVVGVSSWNEPGVYCGATSRYTDVGYFRDWLKATINGDTFVIPETIGARVRIGDEDDFSCSAAATLRRKYLIMFFSLVTTSYFVFLMYSGTTNLTN